MYGSAHEGGAKESKLKIASLVVRIRPGTDADVRARLQAVPGAEVHDLTPDGGRLIVTVEDGEGYSVADSVLAVTQAEGVLGTTLAYEFSGEESQEDQDDGWRDAANDNANGDAMRETAA